MRGSGVGRGAEDGEELLAAVWVGDKGDWLIAEGVEEFVWGERCWCGEWLVGGEVRLWGGGGDELGDEGGGDGEEGGGAGGRRVLFVQRRMRPAPSCRRAHS